MDLHLSSLRRILAVSVLAGGIFALSGCGSVSETLSTSASSSASGSGTTQEIYFVFTSDSQAALNLIDTSGQGLTEKSGDVHKGTKLCATTLTHAGHSFALTVYVTGSVAGGEAQTCSELKNEASASSTSADFWKS